LTQDNYTHHVCVVRKELCWSI